MELWLWRKISTPASEPRLEQYFTHFIYLFFIVGGGGGIGAIYFFGGGLGAVGRSDREVGKLMEYQAIGESCAWKYMNFGLFQALEQSYLDGIAALLFVVKRV